MRVPKPAKHGRDHCPGGEDPIPCLASSQWAMLAIPSGQSLPNASLEVVVNYSRAQKSGTAFTVNGATGRITINEKGVYDIHSVVQLATWAGFDVIEGPVFQAGQDFQDVGNGLHTHRQHGDYNFLQHKTTLFAADLPQSVNLQVRQNTGAAVNLIHAALTIVKIADYTA